MALDILGCSPDLHKLLRIDPSTPIHGLSGRPVSARSSMQVGSFPLRRLSPWLDSAEVQLAQSAVLRTRGQRTALAVARLMTVEEYSHDT
jgi:hypothetical protein